MHFKRCLLPDHHVQGNSKGTWKLPFGSTYFGALSKKTLRQLRAERSRTVFASTAVWLVSCFPSSVQPCWNIHHRGHITAHIFSLLYCPHPTVALWSLITEKIDKICHYKTYNINYTSLWRPSSSTTITLPLCHGYTPKSTFLNS